MIGFGRTISDGVYQAAVYDAGNDSTLALLVVTICGASFTAIKLGLGGVPPVLVTALRFVFAALPAILFVCRPAMNAR